MSLYQVDALRRVGERLRRSDRLRAEGCGPESAPPSPGGGARRGPAALAWGRRGPAPRALARCAFGFRAFRGMAALGAFGPLFTLSPPPPRGGAPFAAPPRRSRRRSPRCARSASGPLWGRGGWLRPSPPAFAGPPLAGPPLSPAVLCRCCAPPDKSPGAQKKGRSRQTPTPKHEQNMSILFRNVLVL